MGLPCARWLWAGLGQESAPPLLPAPSWDVLSLPHLDPALCCSSLLSAPPLRALPSLSPQCSIPPMAACPLSLCSFRASADIYNDPKILESESLLWFLSSPLPGNPPCGPAHLTPPPASPLLISDRTHRLHLDMVFPWALLLQQGALWSSQ